MAKTDNYVTITACKQSTSHVVDSKYMCDLLNYKAPTKGHMCVCYLSLLSVLLSVFP